MYSIKPSLKKQEDLIEPYGTMSSWVFLRPICVPMLRYRMYSDKSVFQIEWIDKLNRLGFLSARDKKLSCFF